MDVSKLTAEQALEQLLNVVRSVQASADTHEALKACVGIVQDALVEKKFIADFSKPMPKQEFPKARAALTEETKDEPEREAE